MSTKTKPRQHHFILRGENANNNGLPDRNMAVHALFIQIQLQLQVYKIKAKPKPV
jgi:hypothetical protein